jgi:probable HAF family extracellular repeat protein
MKSRTLTCITAAMIVFVALAIPLQLTAQHTRYTVTDLGTLGGTFSFAGGINNRGDIEGFSTLPGDTAVRAFLWRKGLMSDLGTLGGPNSFASWRLNERDEVGGTAETTTPDPLGEDFCGFGTHLICLPSVWQKGVPTPLPTLGGNNGFAAGVNSRGQVVGQAENNIPDPTCESPQALQFKPVVWEKGQVQELPTFPGDPDGFAATINDRGQIAGVSGSCTTPFHAVLWQNGTVTDLGSLGGTVNFADDINNQGQVAGFSNLPGDATTHAFLWEKGVMTDLGTLPGDVSSSGDGINSKGQVVGGSFDIDGNARAFLWQNGVMTDLNTLIPADSPLFLIEATGTINSRGDIAGFALQTSTGEVHAFLATPTNGEVASESAAHAARGQISKGSKVVLSENVRKMFREHLTRRYPYRGFGVWPRK